jgi:hypothetical protein
MLDDLTAEEVVAVVHLCKVAEHQEKMVMIFVGDTLVPIESVPGMLSLAKKINEAGDREDVKRYLEEVYGKKDSDGD